MYKYIIIIALLLFPSLLYSQEKPISIVVMSKDIVPSVDYVLGEYQRACGIKFVKEGARKPYVIIGWDRTFNNSIMGWADGDILNGNSSVIHLNKNWRGQWSRDLVRGVIRHELMHSLLAMEDGPDKTLVSNSLGSIPKWFAPIEVHILQGWYGRQRADLVIPNWLDPLMRNRRELWAEKRAELEQLNKQVTKLRQLRNRRDYLRKRLTERHQKILLAKKNNSKIRLATLLDRQKADNRELQKVKAELESVVRLVNQIKSKIADINGELAELNLIIESELDRYN